MPLEVSLHTRQEHCFDKARGLILSPLYAKLIKQSTLVTEDLRSILTGTCLFVVTFQKQPDLADLDRLFLNNICNVSTRQKHITLCRQMS